jgi:hypothetical protein
MMGGGCEPFCVWNSEMTTDDIEMAIELEDFPAWVEDVKRIFSHDLRENGKAKDRWVAATAASMCCPAPLQQQFIYNRARTATILLGLIPCADSTANSLPPC